MGGVRGLRTRKLQPDRPGPERYQERGRGRQDEEQEPESAEMRQLRRELADVKEERDILKKVVNIFSKPRQ